jgi:hypothetical protein
MSTSFRAESKGDEPSFHYQRPCQAEDGSKQEHKYVTTIRASGVIDDRHRGAVVVVEEVLQVGVF